MPLRVVEDIISSCHSLRVGESSAGWKLGGQLGYARQLGHSDCVVRRCWDQWFREMSFTLRPGSGRPRQTGRREKRHIARNARV
ncbi:UNVERIFIED_CONTAM: hypothetical protein NCL1_16793 [Trichonephila clavipes]